MASGLIGAGLLSGLGQGIQSAAQTLQTTQLQRDLEADRQAMENLRQDRMINAQRELEGMREAGAERRLTADIKARGEEAQKEREFKGVESKAERDFRQLNFTADRTLKTKEIEGILDYHRQQMKLEGKKLGLEEKKINFETGKFGHVTLGDGRIALIDPTGSKVVDVLRNKDGSEIHVPAPLGAGGEAMIKALTTHMSDYSFALKNPLLTPDDQKKYLGIMEEDMEKIRNIAQPGTGSSKPMVQATEQQWEQFKAKNSSMSTEQLIAAAKSRNIQPPPSVLSSVTDQTTTGQTAKTSSGLLGGVPVSPQVDILKRPVQAPPMERKEKTVQEGFADHASTKAFHESVMKWDQEHPRPPDGSKLFRQWYLDREKFIQEEGYRLANSLMIPGQ